MCCRGVGRTQFYVVIVTKEIKKRKEVYVRKSDHNYLLAGSMDARSNREVVAVKG